MKNDGKDLHPRDAKSAEVKSGRVRSRSARRVSMSEFFIFMASNVKHSVGQKWGYTSRFFGKLFTGDSGDSVVFIVFDLKRITMGIASDAIPYKYGKNKLQCDRAQGFLGSTETNGYAKVLKTDEQETIFIAGAAAGKRGGGQRRTETYE